MLNIVDTRGFIGIVPMLAVLAGGCTPPIPYIGRIELTPDRRISISDTRGQVLTGYDLFVFRCTQPGSRDDRVFSYPNVGVQMFELEARSRPGIKLLGGAFVAPDFVVSYEPEPYWVACVTKRGFASRRWLLGGSKGDHIRIVLHESEEADADACKSDPSGWSPCCSYDYFVDDAWGYGYAASCADSK